MVVELAPHPWLQLPDVAGVNVYRYPPAGAIVVPAIVYRPDQPWIDRRASFKVWAENYVAVCIVLASSGQSGIAQLYDMALQIKQAIDSDRALSDWEWHGAGGIVRTEQAGLEYLACAVQLTYSAEY